MFSFGYLINTSELVCQKHIDSFFLQTSFFFMSVNKITIYSVAHILTANLLILAPWTHFQSVLYLSDNLGWLNLMT